MEVVKVHECNYEVLDAISESLNTDIEEVMDEILENYLDDYISHLDTTKEKLMEAYRKKHE